MKTYSLYFLLLFNICSIFCDNKNVDNADGELVGNPDDFSIIERPCQIYDIHCIRKFFASHAKCTIAKGPISDFYYRTQDSFYLTNSNITCIINNFMLNGLSSARIEEFYINKATNNVVFAVNFRNLTLFTPDLYFMFYRRAREPIVSLTTGSITFPSVTYTAIIPNVNDMQLDHAEVTGFSDDAFPPVTFNPEVLSDPDPTVIAEFAEFLVSLPIDVQESLLADSPFYPSFYIQTNICDFGLDVDI